MSLSISIGDYSSKRTTALVLRGTFISSATLGLLLILHDALSDTDWIGNSSWILFTVFAFLFLAEVLLRKGRLQIVNYMLIAFYLVLAFCVMLFWGLNEPVGILSISFAVILPSILIGAKSIMPVAAISVLALSSVQLLHTYNNNLTLESSFWDVAIYSTILSVFALVSWLAGDQREKNLDRALAAEKALKSQKEHIASELEKESAALRLAQLDQIRHLHKFALLGQSTAATLHDLSNHLSVLNLDIDDLHQQSSNSETIENAKESINHINKMVRQARQQLNAYDQPELFNAIPAIHRSIKDASAKFNQYNVKLIKKSHSNIRSFSLNGNPLALMQIITILLNNALDACKASDKPEVTLEIKSAQSHLYISVIDNGPGIDPTVKKKLFSPITSKKPCGLGVGLYIAQHLTEVQFNGKISLIPSTYGARFQVIIPKHTT